MSDVLQELIIVQWSDGKAAVLHWSVIRSIVVLLTRGPPSGMNDDHISMRFFSFFVFLFIFRLSLFVVCHSISVID